MRSLPRQEDFPPGSFFAIKEFDVPLVNIPGKGWFNWYGGTPRSYDPTGLKPDNNWRAESFDEWVAVIAAALK